MILIQLSPSELELLRTLLGQYEELVQVDSDDPALERLFPVAYREDPDAAAEFRQYTRSGLVDTKTAKAGAVAAALLGGSGDDGGTIELTDDEAERWLPVLTDLRLIVAERLGIRGRRRPGARRRARRGLRLARPAAGVPDRRDRGAGRGAARGVRVSLELTAEEFEKVVVDELDELPDEMVDGLENLVFVVEDRPEDGTLDLLGEYQGVALTERDRYGFGELPDRIVLFREPLLAICDDLDELRDEIHVTLVHEIAHFYGIDDDELHRLGWA